MKTVCRGETITINESDIKRRFDEMKSAYVKTYLDGTWHDYCECNRAIDAEIERRVNHG